MKKMLALMTMLLLFAVGGITAVCFAVTSDEANVTITERSLYGDKRAAEGLTVTSVSHYANHLRWDTVYQVGKGVLTDYSFHASKMLTESIQINDGLDLYVDIDNGCDYTVPANFQRGIARAYKELYDAAEPGVEASKIVYLKDFYDFYPIRLNIVLPGVFWSGDDYDTLVEDHKGSEKAVRRAFNDFFRIPVLENEFCEISVTKSKSGNSINMGMGTGAGVNGSDTAESYFFDTDSAVTDDTCFFTINNRTSAGNLIDTSLIPGGYGIYSVKYTEATNMYTGSSELGFVGIDADSLAMVYKLDDEVITNNLLLSKDGKKLLLITSEANSVWFSVIEIASMTLLQKFELEGFATQSYTLHDHDDFILLMNWDRLALVAIEEDGSYAFKFCSATARGISDAYQYVTSTATMAYDGERLAIVSSINDAKHSGLSLCSFYIAVYGEGELLYYGEYDSSLSVNPDALDYNINCLPFGHNAYRATWN